MNEERIIRFWLDIGGIDETYLDELEEDAVHIAARAKKRRKVKYGAIVATAATLSAAVAFVVLRPQLASELARKATHKFRPSHKAA